MRKLTEYLKYLKSPYTMISVAVAAGVLINIYLASVLVGPKVREEQLINNRIEALQQQKSALEKQPIPAKITDEDFERLVEQVPTNEEWARLFFTLKELERSSGAVIENVNRGKDTAANDPFASLNGLSKQQQTANAQSSGSSANPPQNGSGQAQNSEKKEGSSIEEHALNLTITGSYKQGMDFISGLYQLSRFVNVKKWSVTAGITTDNPSQQTAAGPPGSETKENIRVTLDLSVYSASAYHGKFKDLPPISPKSVDIRLDPTWTEEHFQALLQTQQP